MMSLRLLASLALTCVAFSPAAAQLPSSVKIVVPFPPGGVGGFLSRNFADHLSVKHNVTAIVENKPGANGSLGAEYVARAPADGTTIALVANGIAVNQHVRKVGYDVMTSFEPICRLIDSSNVIAVNAKSPFRTLADLVEAARKRPGEVSISTIGPASGPHLAIELFRRAAKIDLTYVPVTGKIGRAHV
mgnify:CR=1 FL=1